MDIIKKVNALGLVDQYTIAKSLGQEDEFCKAHGIDIEKGGKAAAMGEIREFGGKKYQKQANGWRPVKKGDQKVSEKKEEKETFPHNEKYAFGESRSFEEAKTAYLDRKPDYLLVRKDTGKILAGYASMNVPNYSKYSGKNDTPFKIISGFQSTNPAPYLDQKPVDASNPDDWETNLKPESKESSLDLSSHSKQDLLDAMTARAKSGVSESDPEMKQLQAELDKRGAEKKPHDYIKDSPNALVQESIDKFADKKGKAKFDAVVQDLLSQKVDPEKIKSGLRNLRPGHTVGEASSFVNKEFDRVAGSKPSSSGTHISDMSKEQKYAAAAKFGIENPEKLSSKELDKQLVDKNIEAELKKFKESKGEDKKEIKADKESSWRDNLKVGDEFSSGGRRGRIVGLTDNPNYVKIDEGFLGIKTISKEVLHPTKDSDHISEKYKEKYSQK